jgi:hypothetical protein
MVSCNDPPPPPPDGGGAAAVTVNTTDVGAESPTLLEQTSVYVSVPAAVGLIVCEPLAAKAPDQLPDAVQLAAVGEDQVMVVEPPVVMELAASVRLGAGGTASAVTVNVTDVACELPAEFAQTIV